MAPDTGGQLAVSVPSARVTVTDVGEAGGSSLSISVTASQTAPEKYSTKSLVSLITSRTPSTVSSSSAATRVTVCAVSQFSGVKGTLRATVPVG